MSIAEEFQAALNSAGYSLERQMERVGLTLAVVTNVSDPDKLNRVCGSSPANSAGNCKMQPSHSKPDGSA